MPRPKKFEDLNATFNIDVEAKEITTTVEVPVEVVKKANNIDDDVQYVFGVLKDTIEKSREALGCALELAQETDSPRAYEIVGQLIKQTTDSAEKVIDVHKKLKDMDEERKGPTSVTNNAVFVGTTAEALRMIKSQINDK